MRLRKLEIFGFKSFPEKTVVLFEAGMTAIVGPNGCGKSNLADAILWVMGEQSPKSLRGARMEDVLFNGTESRRPLGMAEVALTFGDITAELPPPYHLYAEVTITRRLYRSGESEYLINKMPTRLKDIRDLLIDTGVGYRAHAVIEQGRVSDMIAASPLQRRELVEEVAGVAKYRLRKLETLRKLEATEQNLARLSDIVGEVKRQIQGLDRQVKRAEKFRGFKEELKVLELSVARREWERHANALTHLSVEARALQDQEMICEGQLTGLTSQHLEMKLTLTDKDQAISAIKNQVFEAEGQIQRLEGQMGRVDAQRKEWKESRVQTNLEMEEMGRAAGTSADELRFLKREEEEVGWLLPAYQLFTAELKQKGDWFEGRAVSERAALELNRAELFMAVSELAASENHLLYIEKGQEDLRRREIRGGDLLREAGGRQQKVDEEVCGLEKALEVFKEGRIAKNEKSRLEVETLHQCEAALKSQRERLSLLKEEWAGASAQLATREEFYRGLLKAGDNAVNLPGFQGMIADLIEVPAEYETAIEAALENRLRGMLVETQDEIVKGIRALSLAALGRRTLIPRHPRLTALRQDCPVGDGVIGFARDLISCREGYESLASLLLGDRVIVSDFDTAIRLCEGSFTTVTLQGEVMEPSGVVSGGIRSETSILEQKRELKELARRVAKLAREIHGVDSEVLHLDRLQQEGKLRLEALNQEARSLEMAFMDAEKNRQNLLLERSRIQNGIETSLIEQEEVKKEWQVLAASEAAERARRTQLQTVKEAKDLALGVGQKRVETTQQVLRLLKDEILQMTVKTSSYRERQHHLAQQHDRILRAEERLKQRVEEKKALLLALDQKWALSETEEGEAQGKLAQQVARRGLLLDDLREKTEAHAVCVSHLQQMEGQLHELRSGLGQIQKRLQEKSLQKMEAKMEQDKVCEAILIRYQMEIANIPLSEGPFDPAGGAATAGGMATAGAASAREKIGSLQRAIEEMGSVNVCAIEEYQELNTRYQFLTAQEKDLTQAMGDLKTTIARINETTRDLFVTTFHQLNAQFGEIFVSFFGGGKAELVLLDEAHPLDSGVDLIARLPGKGQRANDLLSGGEKALTAISLLFATFLIHPTPFCLLDEIDAPLDDENTRRFAESLQKMSDRTQFIVVTHNKRTMEVADILYGVTMEEIGVSKLLSVVLDAPRGETAHQVEDSPNRQETDATVSLS